MGLTEEQKERIRVNRERALELRKRKIVLQEEEEHQQQERDEARKIDGCIVGDREVKRQKSAEKNASEQDAEEGCQDEVETFEEGASDLVTKQEAMKMYCLPAGTLAVCEVVEKPNPRNGAWSNMKLFRRSEVRRRARQRYGGLEGLVAERQKREENRFKNDMERTKNIFR